MKAIIFGVSFLVVTFFSLSLQDNYHAILSNILSLAFVLGGTLLATCISFSMEKIRTVVSVIRKTYFFKHIDYATLIHHVIHIARDYKRGGFKALEASANTCKNPYLKLGIQLIADNSPWEHIQSSIEKEFLYDGMENESAQRIIHAMAKFAPAFGLAGTIIGLMMVFPQLTNPKNIGSAMSLALLTTLYGVLTANLILLPLENKLKENAADDAIMYQFVIEALHCIQQREYSVVIEQRLTTIMPRHQHERYLHEKKAGMHLKIAHNQ
ncbi:MAG: MotA/TolQ/ExbB proton channel family protein [Desulfobacterota bacterium]|nr:MotA/TolQ/ExbB proton channel family protein [Thermodesulfobacteriota bacterium]